MGEVWVGGRLVYSHEPVHERRKNLPSDWLRIFIILLRKVPRILLLRLEKLVLGFPFLMNQLCGLQVDQVSPILIAVKRNLIKILKFFKNIKLWLHIMWKFLVFNTQILPKRGVVWWGHNVRSLKSVRRFNSQQWRITFSGIYRAFVFLLANLEVLILNLRIELHPLLWRLIWVLWIERRYTWLPAFELLFLRSFDGVHPIELFVHFF